MKQLFTFLIGIIFLWSCESPFSIKKDSFITHFEKTNGEETPTYEEVIQYYKELALEYGSLSLKTMGKTDSGYPLHIIIYNNNGNFNFDNIRENKSIILINNAIHPGESDGVDATMLLFRNLAQHKISIPKNVAVVAIPIYNIGGALNRNSTTRVNQNGPKEYGFRGNAKNYDLNRDFIKADSKNARSFADIFQKVRPDVFIDNHSTNGADYQYILTYDISQPEKLGDELGNYLKNQLITRLKDSLAQRKISVNDTIANTSLLMTPYVNVFNYPPDSKGFTQMLDIPRYSTGYASLWNTLPILVETHMLKPYKQRVEANYELMKALVEIVNTDSENIRSLRKEQEEKTLAQETLPIRWELDSTQVDTLNFHGYKADTLISEVTGLPRLCYNREQPFVKNIPYYNVYKPIKSVKIPEKYIIPQTWNQVIERLKDNKVDMQTFDKDTVIFANYYRIEDYKTLEQPFEGHYLHYDTQVSKKQDSIHIRKGDFWISPNQKAKKYIIATLEPEADDSFFNWNFFDTVLQRKEGFSPYVFEDIALEFLNNNPEIKEAFELKKHNDKNFAKNSWQQLNWIYEQTPYYEKAHLRYPIYFQ